MRGGRKFEGREGHVLIKRERGWRGGEERGDTGGGADGREICAWKLYILHGDKSDGFEENKKSFIITVLAWLEIDGKKKAGSDEEVAEGGIRAVLGKAITTLPPRRGGPPTAVLSPARRSAAGRMECGGTGRPPEAE